MEHQKQKTYYVYEEYTLTQRRASNGYNIKEDRIKIKDRDKKSLKLKIKSLEKKIKEGEISSRDAYKYVAGYMGYIKVADVKKLTEKLFYCGKL